MTLEDQNLPLPAAGGGETYGQILESSAVIGGSSILNIAVGVIRTKAMALLLGPAGFGLFGLYASIVSVAECIAGMGISSSAVRQIAQSVASGDSDQVSRTTTVLRRVTLLLGLLGAAALIALSRRVSLATFGDEEHAGAVALLSVVVFFELVSSSQRALLQGMRQIHALAITAVLGGVLGLLVSVPIVFFLRERGVVPAILGAGLLSLLVTWRYSRRIRPGTGLITRSQGFEEASSLLRLGFMFMASYLMTTGSAYVVRIIVLRNIGYEAMGLYQSAWTLGGLYVGFILQAMGADFYPRLSAVAGDNRTCNRLVNEQTQVGLLLAGPGVLATVTLAPLVIPLFYSRAFGAAVGVVRWICLGTLLQVITWPLSYIIVAKGKQVIFILCESAWGIVSLGLAWICVRRFGLTGAGLAFVGSYVVYGLIQLFVARSLSGFRWSAGNVKTGSLLLCLISIVFFAFHRAPLLFAAGIGVVAVLLSGAYSIRTLTRLVPWDRIPRPVQRLLRGVNLHSLNAARVE